MNQPPPHPLYCTVFPSKPFFSQEYFILCWLWGLWAGWHCAELYGGIYQQAEMRKPWMFWTSLSTRPVWSRWMHSRPISASFYVCVCGVMSSSRESTVVPEIFTVLRCFTCDRFVVICWTAGPLNMGLIGWSKTSLTTRPRSVTCQRCIDLIYTMAEVCIHTVVPVCAIRACGGVAV